MENILQSYTGFSPLLYIAILLIFAAFVIIGFFIHGQGHMKPLIPEPVSQKSLKVYRRQAIDLSSDTLHDILAFFNRKSLSCLRSLDSRFNQTIQREFANTPYLVFYDLFISEVANEKSVQRCMFNKFDGAIVDLILAEKFVRFNRADVMCDDFAYVTQLLSKSEKFDLKFSEKFKLTKFRARRLAKSRNVNTISFRGRLTLLPELLLGNCRRLEVSDDLFTTADSVSVPWMKILDFLFRPSESYETGRYVYIKTNDPPGLQFLQLTDPVKQRFTTATTRLHFNFHWRTCGFCKSIRFHNDVEVKNIHGQGRLILDKSEYRHDSMNIYSILSMYTKHD